MSVSLIVWGRRPDINASVVLGDTLAQFSSVHKADSFEEVLWLMEENPDVKMILFIGEHSILQMLPAIQSLHARYPRVSVIAFPNNATSPRTVPFTQPESVPARNAEQPSFGRVDDFGRYVPAQTFDETGEYANYHLTPRQKDVLMLITNGKSNKQIARQLGMTEGTVKIHCMAIFRTLHVTNRTQAAMVFKQMPENDALRQ